MNAWGAGQRETLGGYVAEALNTWKGGNDFTSQTPNMAIYLLQKIGYIDSNDKVHGMCASAMKQCQDYTFTSDAKRSTHTYILDNEVVRMYLNNTLAKIKVQQDALLADYAEGCRGDVQSCLSSNGYDDAHTSSTVSRTAVNACAQEITTCMSVGGYAPKDGTKLTLRAMNDWIASLLISCPVDSYLIDDGIGDGTEVSSQNTTGTALICRQCPVVAVVTKGSGDTYNETSDVKQTISSGGQATTCQCPDGLSAIYINKTTHKVLAAEDIDIKQLADQLRCIDTSSN